MSPDLLIYWSSEPSKGMEWQISAWTYKAIYQTLILIVNQGMTSSNHGNGSQPFSKILQVPDTDNHRLPLFPMLLSLAVILFVKRYGTTQAAPLPSRALDIPAIACNEFPNESQIRTVLDILWSCLVTTFACTWVCVHPNVPFCKEDSRTILGRRAFLMFFSIIAPEFMVIWAFKQWRGARMIMEVINDAFPDSRPWTTTHGHFLQMGGFKIAMTPQEYANALPAIKHVTGDEVLEGVLTFNALKLLLTENLVWCPTITEDEINDKSKGDALSKGIAFMQITWFIVQIIIRAAQGSAITELELTTAALAGLNSVMYLFWWSKPRDVRFPMVLWTKGVEELLLSKKTEDVPCVFQEYKFCFGEHLWKMLTKSIRRKSDAIGSFLLSIQGRIICAPPNFVGIVKAIPNRLAHLLFGLLPVCDTERNNRSEPDERGSRSRIEIVSTEPSESGQRQHHSLLLFRKCAMKYVAFPFTLLISLIDWVIIVPVAKILLSSSDESLADAFGCNTSEVQSTLSMIFYSEDADVRTLLGSSSIAGALFGAVHFLAWNSSFPSSLEQTLWRAASLGVVLSCGLSLTGTLVLYIAEYIESQVDTIGIAIGCVLAVLGTLLPIFTIPVPLVYPLARITLLVLAVASLRSLPLSGFYSIPWFEFIPHI